MNYGYVKSDELYHYGVKGMKWRHRKKQRMPSSIDSAVRWGKSADEFERFSRNNANRSFTRNGAWETYRSKRDYLAKRSMRDRRMYDKSLLGRLGVNPAHVIKGKEMADKLLKKIKKVLP